MQASNKRKKKSDVMIKATAQEDRNTILLKPAAEVIT